MKRYYGKDEASGSKKNILLWVAPGAVRYDREDIEFLLPWLLNMREGRYPSEPTSGYIGGKRSGGGTRAYFEAACQIAAELDNRLKHTGVDHYLVIDSYCNGLSDEDIAIKLFMPTREVRRHIESAISYIASGQCARWLNCIDCGKYQRCRRKKRVGMNYREWRRRHINRHKAKKHHFGERVLTKRS